jgi:hypothetical protein
LSKIARGEIGVVQALQSLKAIEEDSLSVSEEVIKAIKKDNENKKKKKAKK